MSPLLWFSCMSLTYSVREPCTSTQLELRLQRHDSHNTEHAGIIESFHELSALRVSEPQQSNLNETDLSPSSNDSCNSRSSYESGFYNSLSRSNSPINEPPELNSPAFENHSLAELMVSSFHPFSVSFHKPILSWKSRAFSTWINRRWLSSNSNKNINRARPISTLKASWNSCKCFRPIKCFTNSSSINSCSST